MNWLDKSIAWVNPEAGVKRARSRVALDLYSGYEGARRDRRFQNWKAPATGPNEDLKFDLDTLRDRSRDLARNTPHGARAVNSLAAHMIGTGIQPRIVGEDVAKLQDAWKRFSNECDYDGRTDFSGLQTQAARCVVESGEALMIYRPAPARMNLKVPFQLQLLEPDFIDSQKNTRHLENGGFIMQGIEFDSSGRKVAYWLFDRHPGDGFSRPQSKRVPQNMIVHPFEVKRIGQQRGVPWMAPVIAKMKDMDDYNQAELFAKKIQACFAIFIQSDEADRKIALDGAKPDSKSGFSTQKFKPGMQIHQVNGDDVKFATPPVSQGYREYSNSTKHDIAAGVDLPYEMLTGDLSQVNYSSFRAGYINFRQRMDQLRYHMWIPTFCERTFRWFYDTGIGAGAFEETEHSITWTPPKYISVDPIKDYKASLIAVRSGMMSPQEAISEYGYDPLEVLEEFEQWNALLDDKEIIFDSDPRNSTASGVMQVNNNEASNGND